MRLLPILKQVEQPLHVLPHRQFKPASNDEQPTEKIQKIIIDAERPVADPTTPANKNIITVVKNIIIP